MATLSTLADPSSEAFRARAAHNRALAEKLRADVARTALGGAQASRDRHVSRGKLLPRDRVGHLLDPGAPFLEIGQLAANGQYNDEVPGAGVIAGIGRVSGRMCMIVCNDATVKGGTYYPLTVKKHLRAQEIALENRLPCIYLVDSGGANLPHQAEVFPDRDHFGRIFFNQAQMSAQGIAQIACVMGSCTAGGAYVPAMSDESVIVRNQGTIFLAGPPLVKAATGEVITAEELGGGDLHARKSGVVDHLAENDEHALTIVRDIVATLPADRTPDVALKTPRAPKFAAEELYGLIPEDVRAPMTSMRSSRGSSTRPSSTSSSRSTGRRWSPASRISGGCRSRSSPTTACCSRRPPSKARISSSSPASAACRLLFLQNISGFMVGGKYEAEGIAKHGAKLVTAVATASVPKITVLIGGSFGAGNYGMAGRAYSPALPLFLAQQPDLGDGRRTGRLGVGHRAP